MGVYLRLWVVFFLVSLGIAPQVRSEPLTSESLTRLLEDSQIWENFLHIDEELPETKETLTLAEQRELIARVRNHPVASVNALGKYDPEGYIGFCFGRAMAVHLMARKMGLAKDSIKKLFVVGDLRSGPEPEWRFHVTTVIRGENGQWSALDPIMTFPIANGDPQTLEQWMSTVQRVWDKEGKAKYYLTSADVVMPDVTKDPDGTTGKHILELGFEPESFSGFEKEKIGTFDVYRMDEIAEERFHIVTRGKDRFDFEGVQIGESLIDYRNYFRDLLGDLKRRPGIKLIQEAARPVPTIGPMGVPCQKVFKQLRPGTRIELRSPNFRRFFQGNSSSSG